jgi:hypothetical protein
MSAAVDVAAIDVPLATPSLRGMPADRIPTRRLVGVELRKMFDTRSGFWLITGGAILAAVATVVTVLFAPDDELTYEAFAAAIGMPLSVLLPMTAILAVTSEWSQRTGLSTFTLVPHRGRVIRMKLAATLIVGVASIALAFGIGALGNLIGSQIAGVPLTWDVSASRAATIFLADALGMLMGFTLGVLIRNSAGAIVGYFVYGLVLPAALGALASAPGWFRDLQGWVDFQFSSTRLYEENLVGQDWGHLATSGLIWLVIPLAIGLRLVVRSEVK